MHHLITLLEQKVVKSHVLKIFQNYKLRELKVAELKVAGFNVAQNFKTKSRGNLLSRKIQKLRVAGINCRAKFKN